MSPITKKVTINKSEPSVALNLSFGSPSSFSNSCSTMSYNEMPSSPCSSTSSSSSISAMTSSSTNGATGQGGKRQYGRVNRIVLDKNSDEYRKRRERNNMAVKKSRNKSKVRTQQTLQRVAELKTENERLETKVKILSKELSFLKDLFLAHAGSSHTGASLGEVLFNGSHDTSSGGGVAGVAGVAGSAAVPMAAGSLSSPINSNIISSTGSSFAANLYAETATRKREHDLQSSSSIFCSAPTSDDEDGH